MTAFTLFVTSKRIDSTVQETVKQFEEAGFIVHTREPVDVPTPYASVEEQDRAGMAAQRTIDAIKSADAMIVLNGRDWGRAMHEEKAVAVALGKPVVIVDQGAYRPSTQLDFHPAIRRIYTLNVSEAVAEVIALRDGSPQPPQSELLLPAPVED